MCWRASTMPLGLDLLCINGSTTAAIPAPIADHIGSAAMATGATYATLRDQAYALLATPPSGKYPYIYTRDLAITIAALCELDSLDVARDFCRFLLRAQSPDGSWLQRYDLDGRAAHITSQEDATALAIWALLTYVKAAGDDTLVEVAREPIERATTYTVECTLNSYLYLVETTGSKCEVSIPMRAAMSMTFCTPSCP